MGQWTILTEMKAPWQEQAPHMTPFQNVPINLEKPPQEHEISVRPLATQSRTTVKLRSQVKCQQIIHDICIALGDELTRCLPALHALTGCDTTSKVSTKPAALKALRKPGSSSFILNFDSPQLIESAVLMAETFLVKCLKPSMDLETCVLLHLIASPHN